MQHEGEDDFFIPLGQVTPGYLSCGLANAPFAECCRVFPALFILKAF